MSNSFPQSLRILIIFLLIFGAFSLISIGLSLSKPENFNWVLNHPSSLIVLFCRGPVIGLIAGIGLLRRKKWGNFLAQVALAMIAISFTLGIFKSYQAIPDKQFLLPVFFFGLMIGVWLGLFKILWYLNKREIKNLLN